MKRPRIISVGEVLWDLFPDGERFGGAPANFACHAALQGADATMLSAVGDDDRGRDAIEILRGYDVDVGLIQTVPDAPTGTVGVKLDDEGKPTYVINEGSAWDQMTWDDQIVSRLASADAVCFGTLGQRSPIARQTIRRSIEKAADAGVTRIVDINLRSPFYDSETIRDSLQLATILKLSDEELNTVVSACGVAKSSNIEAMLGAVLPFGGLDSIVMTRGLRSSVNATVIEPHRRKPVATPVSASNSP
ncbi:MAG: PfkB family carbohydrate kinase [Planctomycetota bacterium]